MNAVISATPSLRAAAAGACPSSVSNLQASSLNTVV